MFLLSHVHFSDSKSHFEVNPTTVLITLYAQLILDMLIVKNLIFPIDLITDFVGFDNLFETGLFFLLDPQNFLVVIVIIKFLLKAFLLVIQIS